MAAWHVALNSGPAAIGTTSGFTESLESLTRIDRQTHKTHTRNRGGPAFAGFIKGGVDCGDGWEATSSGLNGCVPQHAPQHQPTSECTWTGTRCDLSPGFSFFPPLSLHSVLVKEGGARIKSLLNSSQELLSVSAVMGQTFVEAEITVGGQQVLRFMRTSACDVGQ